MLMESSSVRDYQKSFDQYLPVPDELFAMSHSEDIEFATSYCKEWAKPFKKSSFLCAAFGAYDL